MQVALSPNQEALIQSHLARNYQNLSVAKLLWQKKQKEAVALAERLNCDVQQF